jgi:hypothetical protein
MEFVKSRLLDVEIKRKNSDESQRGQHSIFKQFPIQIGMLYNCGEVGQMKAECRMK